MMHWGPQRGAELILSDGNDNSGGNHMPYLILFVGILAITVIAVTVSGKNRHFDAVGNPDTAFLGHSGRNLDEITMVPTEEEISEEAVFHSEANDAVDDLLDPHNSGHAKWVAEHESAKAPDETAS